MACLTELLRSPFSPFALDAKNFCVGVRIRTFKKRGERGVISYLLELKIKSSPNGDFSKFGEKIMEYKDYLCSEDWKIKRSAKRSKADKCGICGATENLDVHHLNYRNLFDVKQSDLRVLCRRCHFLGHDLMRRGKMVFRSQNHHSRFAIFKSAVKKELRVSTQNLFLSTPLPT